MHMGAIHQKFVRKKRGGGTPKSAQNIECIVHAVKCRNVVRSFDRKFFSVRTSRVAGSLPFSELSPSLTFPGRTETVLLLVARTEGIG